MNVKMQTISVVGAAVIRCLGVSWRITTAHPDHLAAARARSPQVLFAFWHGRLLPLAFTHREQQVQVLASEHPDGEMLGQVIRRLGFGHVRGSSTRGGARAIRELSRLITSGYDLGMTVDGPRGPRFVVKPGPIQIARISGAPIVPITTGSSRHKTFASWDAFELPAPFTRVRVQYGPPVWVPPDADEAVMETKRIELENILRRTTEDCDRMVRS